MIRLMDGERTNEEDWTRRQIILQKFLQMKILEKCLMIDFLTFELSPGHEETLIGTNLTTE